MKILSEQLSRTPEIPSSSLADIAFLLLIFFLVATTIDVDTGIGMTLPPEVDQPPPQIKERNILTILVNDEGDLLVENEAMAQYALQETVKQHVLNCAPTYAYGCQDGFSERPGVAVVSIKTSRATPYAAYIAVLDDIWLAYWEMWNEKARRMGYADYETYRRGLVPDQANAIREHIPAQISLAEPDEAIR
ncbi:MAG TPA: biopolymer transporter ExbD [Rhodothermales bacterium]|nr:biopolymer transporter ExbD [Rhodothermales bacterium]